MKMKLSRILTLIVALGLLGSAVETIPSSVQPAKVAAAQKKTAKKKKKTAKKKKTKKSTSKSKKKSVKKTTSKSKKKTTKKITSKSKKKSKKATSKPKKKSVKKTTSKPKKKTLADRYKPSVRNFKKIKVGVRASSDIFIKDKESLPANTTFKFSKEPNFNKAGSYTTTIIARYSDGSKSISKPFVVVVIPKTDADLYEPTVKDGEAFTGVRFESGSLVTNKGELPKDTWFSIKTSGDFNKVGMYSAQVITHYPDYSKDTSKPVKVRVSEGFSVETSEDQYSPNCRYLMAKVTNKSNKTLNFRESVVGKDSHGNNLVGGLDGVERGPVAPNQTVVLWENLYNEKPYYYDHIDYEIHATDTTHESANSNLKVQIVQKEDSGFCIQTTNIGSKKIYYPEVYVFVYKNGKVFYEQEGLLAGYDKDGLEPGESHTIGFNVSDYDDIEFSYTSSYDK
ncbi:Rib/alpha-like domain-containing protein [Lactobacillus delbrueckii subsp. bulgaricus]